MLRYSVRMGRGQDIATPCWPAWLNATALLFVSFVAVATFSLRVRPGLEIVAVAFPPWWNAQQVFEATASARAAIVRTTALTAILVVRPEPRDGLTRLREAGAWLAIDPQAIAGCFNTNKEIRA